MFRLRIRTDREQYAAYAGAVGEWTQRMREAGMVGRLIIDTYYPEIGRYGHGVALDAAEDVFAADGRVITTVVRHEALLVRMEVGFLRCRAVVAVG